ncbi:branched-chain amino acid ABC transporter permease [Pseudotabrizicola sp. 4114]|uniref:branched-chain amino acid ABC transporter permease n=1 Tax=Pseudotabrizicola sp. 4114 TaxID=2817731 RepID=UPI0028670492|nr:branched-chain amino acid transport system permease protein [Pseudorhodobacter sp. 4114]
MIYPVGGSFLRPGAPWWSAIVLAFVLLVLAPRGLDLALQYDLTSIFICGILALSMSFLWGGVGILSFGQTIFFGLGGYGYTILVMNTDASLMSLVLGVLVGGGMAAVLGYFMIYGRINDIYLSVVTLVVTLIFEKMVRATSGPEYVIGSVRLNGQNGIPGIPGLQLPFLTEPLSIEGVFWFAGGALLLTYCGLRLLMATRFGRILVGIRENEQRMELLGYDTRRYRLITFIISGGVAAFAGGLFAVWGSFVGPEMFNLSQASLIVIWVIVGGRTTLIGPIIGAALIQYLTKWLGTVGVGQVSTVMGAILIVFVLLFPRGLVPTLGDLLSRLRLAQVAQRSLKDAK